MKPVNDGELPPPADVAEESDHDSGPPYVTYAFLLVISVVFAAMYRAGQGDVLRVANAFGDKENDLIRQGQYWRLVTAIFLHGSLLHLAMNSIFLYWFGGQMERIYGGRKYLLILLAAGVTGNLCSIVGNSVPSLGASGALFGLVGAGLVFPLRYRRLISEKARHQILSQLLITTVANFAIGLTPSLHVDNYAHGGGLVGGAFMALFLMPDVLAEGPRPRIVDRTLSFAVAAALLLVLWSGTAQWRWAHSPWWVMRPPRQWVKTGDSWTGPGGAVIQAMDSVRDPRLLAEATVLSSRILPNARVDGHPGWEIQSTPAAPANIDYYLIQAYDRWLAIDMTCRPEDYPHAKADFDATMATLRFLHPPVLPIARPISVAPTKRVVSPANPPKRG